MKFLLAHLVGDYLIQRKWIALRKGSSFWVALLHGTTYALCYLVAYGWRVWPACIAISLTHSVQDYWWWNTKHPGRKWWGYDDSGIQIALAIVVDNTLHLLVNYVALTLCGVVV